MPFDFQQYTSLVKQVAIGKKLPDSIYTHRSALDCYPQALLQLVNAVATNLKLDNEWHIVKLYRRDFKLAFLYYPTFDDYAYPALNKSITVDLSKLSHRVANYGTSKNPPILHRKECFVKESYPQYTEFAAITAEGEAAGLYENTRQIGFKNNWEKSITIKGLALNQKGRLVQPQGYEQTQQTIETQIDRHLTAIDRNKLSAPMQTLAKNGHLNGDYSILDYGCGKGDDARELEAHGLDVSAWDPVHNPEGQLIASDLVNLGFVINVIEDIKERSETIGRAFSLANKLLVVSAMVAGESVISQFTPYKDGVITSRNTFQKYYSQGELKGYLERTLDENAIAIGQGVFYIFKDKVIEQDFMLGRQKSQMQWHSLTFNDKPSPDQTAKITNAIAKHPELFEDFWKAALDLGRIPANQEFEFSQDIRRLAGSHKKAFDALSQRYDPSDFNLAKRKRKEDLVVYFALGLFDKRKAYSKMPESLKRDIKYFFEAYKSAIDIATESLFSVGSPAVIEEVANEAYKACERGEFNHGHSWVIKREWITTLPPELRIYIGCATQLYGDIEPFQLVKIHFTSGKVSLMRYDDWSKGEPLLVERLKIKLREQDIDFFDYAERTRPPLINKLHFTY